MRDGSGTLLGEWIVEPIKAEGGGYITWIDIASNGDKAVGTDVFNGWVRKSGATKWREIFTSDSVAAADYDPANLNPLLTGSSGFGGSATGKYAPSDPTRLYTTANGFFYRVDLTVGGAPTAVKMPMAAKRIQPNSGTQRFFGPMIGVHPTNKDIAILGTNADGVYYTLDGGATAPVAITGLAAPVAFPEGPAPYARYIVSFDPYNANYVYIHVFGVGLYQSSTGVNGTFTLMSGGPNSCSSIAFAPDGRVFVCAYSVYTGSYNTIWVMTRAGAWSNLSNPSFDATFIALDPLNAGRLVALDLNSAMMVSNDYGATWVGGSSAIFNSAYPPNSGMERGGGEVKWYQNKPDAYHAGQIKFDPVVSGRLWLCHGLGVAYSDTVPTAWNVAPKMTWLDYSAGIEELVSIDHYVSQSSGTTFGIFGDKPIWRYSDAIGGGNIPRFPFLNGAVQDINTPQGHCMDGPAIDDPNFLVACIGRTDQRNCFSRDDGKRWEKWDGPWPGGLLYPGGGIAVSTKNNVVIAPAGGNTGRVVYSKNADSASPTWNDITLGGVTPVIASVNAITTLRHIVTSDKTRPGVFAYLANNGNTTTGLPGRDIAGLWVTTDGGDNWTRTYNGVIGLGPQTVGTVSGQDARQFWKAKLAYIPGKTGELLYNPHADDTACPDDKLWHLTSDGAVQTALRPTEIKLVRWFGFGKNLPGASYPAVIIYAKVNGVWGFYVSLDWFATTPFLVAPATPLGRIDKVAHVQGDMTRFGVFYTGFSGSGAMKISYRSRLG